MAKGTHHNLRKYFEPLMEPSVLASIMQVGDSMVSENAQRGNGPNGMWQGFEPPIPTEGKVTHWLGRGVPANNAGNNTQHGQAQTSGTIAGGTATTITPVATNAGADRPNLFGPPSPAANSQSGRGEYSVQQYLDLNWGAGARTGSGGTPVSIFNANLRSNQAGVTVPFQNGNNLGPGALVNRSQNCSAQLIWRGHANSPASLIEVIGTRRATTAGGTTFGTPVGSAVAPDFTANPGRASLVTVDCGSGAGEPGVLVRSIGANVGAESLFLVGSKFLARPTASTWFTAGWFLSSIAASGFTSVDLCSVLGVTATRSGQTLTPLVSLDLARDIVGHMGSYGTLNAPNFLHFRVGQNFNTSAVNPGAAWTEGIADMSVYRANMRLLVDAMRAHVLALNGAYPRILFEGMIATSATSALTLAINDVQRELAREYNESFWDGYARTKDQPLYWYTSAESASTGGDNVHENEQGARWVKRALFEDGMRSLGLDPGVWGGERRPRAGTFSRQLRSSRV